jgi:hypothetical protein
MALSVVQMKRKVNTYSLSRQHPIAAALSRECDLRLKRRYSGVVSACPLYLESRQSGFMRTRLSKSKASAVMGGQKLVLFQRR